MCTPKSAKTCSMVTIVFAFLTLLGMIIGAAVFSSMFGPNLQCYVDAVDATINNALTSPSPPPPDGRRLFCVGRRGRRDAYAWLICRTVSVGPAQSPLLARPGPFFDVYA